MRLIPNARRVFLYGWNSRFLILASVLSGLEVVLPMVSDLKPEWEWWLSFVIFFVIVAAFIARYILQKKVSGEFHEQA